MEKLIEYRDNHLNVCIPNSFVVAMPSPTFFAEDDLEGRASISIISFPRLASAEAAWEQGLKSSIPSGAMKVIMEREGACKYLLSGREFLFYIYDNDTPINLTWYLLLFDDNSDRVMLVTIVSPLPSDYDLNMWTQVLGTLEFPHLGEHGMCCRPN